MTSNCQLIFLVNLLYSLHIRYSMVKDTWWTLPTASGVCLLVWSWKVHSVSPFCTSSQSVFNIHLWRVSTYVPLYTPFKNTTITIFDAVFLVFINISQDLIYKAYTFAVANFTVCIIISTLGCPYSYSPSYFFWIKRKSIYYCAWEWIESAVLALTYNESMKEFFGHGYSPIEYR